MVNVSKLIRKKLGELLVEEGLVREDQIHEALKKQKATGELLGETLVKMGSVSEVDIARAIARQFGLPYLDATKYNILKDAFELAPVEMMYQNQFIIMDKIGKALVLAVSGVLNAEIFEDLERRSGSVLFIYVSTASQVLAALKKYAPQAAGVKG